MAKACDGIDIDPMIFNRSADGKNLSGVYGMGNIDEGFGIPPRIIFDAGAGFIRIYGIGVEGSKILDEEAGKLFSALYKVGFIGFDRKEGAMTMEAQHHDSMYSVRAVVLARNPAVCRQFIKTDLQGDVSKAAGDIFLRGINGVARLLDNELIAGGGSPKFEQALPREITFLEGTSLLVEIKPGVLAAAYKDILISMPCKLRGPWSAGILRSRGYGLIRSFIPSQKK